jgi:hypothetical protein
MRWLIISLFMVANLAQAEEVARPVAPEFIRTELITASGATPALAVKAAYEQALLQANPPKTLTQPVRATNHAVASMVRNGQAYQTQTWVTVRTAN